MTRSIVSSTPGTNESLTLTHDYNNDGCSSVVRFAGLDTPPPTFFYDHRRAELTENQRNRGGFLWRWMPTCFRRQDMTAIDEAYRRAPPSYSTLVFLDPTVHQPFTRSHLAVLLRNDDPSTSFVVRTPPPSYAQAQGVTYSLEQLISNSASDMRMWSARPTSALCRRCASLVYTVVEVRRDAATHLTALALCLMGCWPCCVLPYCIDSCKKSHHYCPFCRTYLGTYTPWTFEKKGDKKSRIYNNNERKRSKSKAFNDGVVDTELESSNFRETPMKKKQKSKYDSKEEARLEELVFGNPSNVIEVLKEVSEENNKKNLGDAIDSNGKVPTAAWNDEDDLLTVVEALKQQRRRLPGQKPEILYTDLLQNKFTRSLGITSSTPKWARIDRNKNTESDDSDCEISMHSNYINYNKLKRSKSLKNGTIDLQVVTEVNKAEHLQGFANIIQFHKTHTLAMVAGTSKVGGSLSLFEVDGNNNDKIHTVRFDKFPIHSAKFLKHGDEILVGSMSHDYCYAFDLMSEKVLDIPLPHGITNMQKFEVSPDGKVIAICGRHGEVHLLYSSTKELIGTLKMNKKCKDLAFTPDSSKLITHGEGSEVYVWDVASRQCVNRAYDDGCLSGMSITVSPNNQFIATGSKQGAVNIYESKSILTERTPQPVKTVLNLVTAITKLEFNPTTEILAMASNRKSNAFRMVHLPSFNVFSNFPTFQTKIFMPLDIDFSPASGFMSVSNNKGFAYLYRLKHYGNY